MAQRLIIIILVLFSLVFIVRSCSDHEPSKRVVRVARDLSWYPLRVKYMQANLMAFSDELMWAVVKEADGHMHLLAVSSDRLIRGLREGEYELAMTSMADNQYNRSRYDLSNLYFMTGPVLVVARNSPISGVDDLVGLAVGVARDSSNIGLVHDGYVTITPFDNMIVGMDSLVRGEISAIIMDGLQALALVDGPYKSRLRVATEPLTDAGLRLIAIKGEHPDLIERFNSILKKMQDDGRYNQLLERWQLLQKDL